MSRGGPSAETLKRSSSSQIGIAIFGSGGPNGIPPGPPTKRPARPAGAGASQSTSLTCRNESVSEPAAPSPPPKPVGDALPWKSTCMWSKWFSTCHSVWKPSLIRCGRTSLITDASIPAG